MKNYYMYVLSNKNNTTLYIGVTNDLEKRVFEHKNKLSPGFTAKYNITKLVYYEDFENIEEAISREKQLKNWHRTWKEKLIREANAQWKDLAVSFEFPEESDPETSSG